MKEFFLILFFAKSLVLTPEPMDIRGTVSFDFEEPVSAITSGAHVRIDVTGVLEENGGAVEIVSILDFLEKNFPEGSITGTLKTATGESLVLDRLNGSSNGRDAELILASSSGLPTGVDFLELRIDSGVELIEVTITWMNHSK